MPSRHLLSPPPPRYQDSHLPPPLAGGVTVAFSCLLLLVLCFRRISKKRTAPSASDTHSKKPPHRLSYSFLRRATANFSPSLRLGQGGFGSVYRADLKLLKDPVFASSHVAVKVMDSGSLQGEREFQTELLFSSKIDSKYIVSVMGFSSNPKKRRMLLVYELMENGSLQDCLFHKKSEELRSWDKRFLIALNIAKGLEYLHHCCDPPIIHGDIKPSNILLDKGFCAKISDFGLAMFKVGENNVVLGEVKKESGLGKGLEENESVVEETESVITVNGFEEVNDVLDLGSTDKSPESAVLGSELLASDGATVVSPGAVVLMDSPYDVFEKTSVSEGNFDRFSVDSGGGRIGFKEEKKKKRVLGKDYVMEWIGNEIKDTRPGIELNVGAISSSEVIRKTKRKKKNVKMEKRRPAREWWKEEYCEELERKNKKQKKKERVKESTNHDYYNENWWPKDDEPYVDRKKKRNRSRSWSWSQSQSRKNSHDSACSTPSMRGTLCYAAPEYGGGDGDDISEKCDVYSYGVLLLVLIAGRRPLQVTGSPISEYQRANLLSWARYLARTANLLDLVDQSIESLNKEQAMLCITVALLCSQKSLSRRPSMEEVVGMLSGDLEPPKLPVELSPSDPSRFTFKNHKKGR